VLPTPASSSFRPDNCYAAFVGNLSFHIDEAAMNAFAKDCGEVKAIRWIEVCVLMLACHAVFADAGPQHRPVQGMWLRRVHHVRGGDVAVKKLYS
jgi:hypothetical protein